MGEHLHTPAFAAYYGLLQVQARTFEAIARELEARTGLPASWYEVLACLQNCEEEGQRMNELADDLLISRGGATKLIARMEEAGLVERFTPKSDRRATYAKLTPKGMDAAMVAHPIQLELTEEYFGRFLDPQQLAQARRRVPLARGSCRRIRRHVRSRRA
jgi:DNA-binding MarR family transcriptional regulator